MTCVISWFRQRRRDESHLLFFPFVFGSNTIPDASAGFIGVNSFHKKAHFLRAIYEGVAFSHLYHTERLRNINPKLSRTIRIAGASRTPRSGCRYSPISSRPRWKSLTSKSTGPWVPR
ncbi:putative L-xylulose kinase [Klebsiella pneumoniae]|uniref:Putative L-xylulose kinase n=1 Tax=Klebsiella pneumoniae TaxID=573 RepID=A0A377WD38_KLEPN|nr:putative L-xylulose kinase [Klebsiella pneumoniae]